MKFIPTPADLTVLVAARNAEATLERALRSIDPRFQIILIDHGSTDRTVHVAREVAGTRIRILGGAGLPTLGAVRQAGLDAVQTRFATWLDADDEWLAGRGTRVLERLSRGDCDVAADATILADEAGTERLVSLPPWASGSAMPARLFERNPLPAIGLIAFHVGTWRDLGYDAGFHGAEDVDIVLRAIAQGVRFGWIAKPGTRVHVRSDSLSRRRDNQRSMYVRALRKHPYPVVRSIYNEAGCDGSTTAEGLASMALFRGDGDAALQFIEEAAAHTVNGWRLAFGRGVAHLLRGDALRAVESLDLAETFSASPEGANNLGVAHATMGDVGAARRWFEAALERFPSYQDARLNLTAATGWRVTTHPLRNRE